MVPGLPMAPIRNEYRKDCNRAYGTGTLLLIQLSGTGDIAGNPGRPGAEPLFPVRAHAPNKLPSPPAQPWC